MVQLYCEVRIGYNPRRATLGALPFRGARAAAAAAGASEQQLEDAEDAAEPRQALAALAARLEAPAPLECAMEAGDTIFVPSGWWHAVLNLEQTVAVTENWADAASAPAVLGELRKRPATRAAHFNEVGAPTLAGACVERLAELPV